MRHLAGVLLHTPTTRAHELAADGRGGEFLSALETLYGLVSDAGEATESEIA